MIAASQGPAVVEVEGISKRFPVRRSWKDTILHPRSTTYQEALHDVSLSVARGEFFGVLGKNGAGKTTLFKILATLVLPDSGQARVDGIDVTQDPMGIRRRLVPVIPYERSLYWRLNAEENLRLYASLQGFTGRRVKERVHHVLEVVDLQNTGTKQVGLFSSGMKQRLLVARALLSDPVVLLLDEPTRSLDPVSARNLRHFLRDRINQEQGCTILLATHDAEEVRELCPRVGILEEGRLVVEGRTDDLFDAVADHRYRLVARGSLAPALRQQEVLGHVTVDGEPEVLDADGWTQVRLHIPGGRAAQARVVRLLSDSGIEVALLAPRDVPLAEVIQAVSKRAPAQDGAAQIKERWA